MKLIPILSALLTLAMAQASWADVCITDIHKNNTYSNHWIQSAPPAYLWNASLTCRQMDQIEVGLEVISIGFQGAGIYAACTGVGLTATVVLEGGALALNGLSLLVSHLDCDDSESQEQIEEKVDEAVCKALRAQGIQCELPILSL